MSSDKALVAIVAAYVGVVLWFLAFGDSLRDFLAPLVRRSRRRKRVYFMRGLAGAASAVLIVGAAVAARDVGSGGGAPPAAAPQPQRGGPIRPARPRVVSPPVVASHPRPRTQVHSTTRRAKASVPTRRLPAKQTTRVSYVVRTGASTPASTGVSTTSGQASVGTASGPLPAPAGASAPTPLKAP